MNNFTMEQSFLRLLLFAPIRGSDAKCSNLVLLVIAKIVNELQKKRGWT